MHGSHASGSRARTPAAARSSDPVASRGVPTIVFHGDHDTTVAPKNGAAIAEQALAKLASDTGPLAREAQTHSPMSAQGRHSTRVTHADRDGVPWVEHWTVHGGGHAWSGGNVAGSFVEPHGPDASREMLRFFLLHERREAPVLTEAAA
jgi:poly(3-hydroxybutyrate) depolymerase